MAAAKPIGEWNRYDSIVKTFAFGVGGAIIGGMVAGAGGIVLGFALGALWSQLQALSGRLTAVETELRELARRSGEAAAPVRRELAAPAPRATDVPSSAERAVPRPVLPPPIPPSATAPAVPVSPSTGPLPAPPAGRDRHAGWIVEFFTTGNIVAKVGVVILFFGVAFLLRFAAERGVLPIEYRLMAVTAGALVLLAVGWRLRHSRPEYAMAVQGGAIGILYLTIFAAFRLYDLLPAVLTFALLLSIVALSGVLAVAQNAQSLAVLGTTGGFLAPVLASAGGGSHVGLFTYYLLLNAGVVGLAWFRSWRLLNWLGFVFTFGVGFAWGARYYEPRFFASTEPFLIAFFVFYVSVAVLFAQRQRPELRGYIDGSLVFGTPAIAFAMQSALVRDMPFGRAYSAIAVSALYVLLARGLWRRDAALRPLAEAFLSLGVVFLTLAVPFAFDGRATATAWALEGAGLAWVGARQNRVLARVSGAALQIAAGLTFAIVSSGTSRETPVLNSTFLGSAMLAAGGVLSAYQFFRAREIRLRWEEPLEWVLLAWGLLWWSGAIGTEVDRFLDGQVEVHALVMAAAASAVLLAGLAAYWRWPALQLATLGALPLFGLLAIAAFDRTDRPLADFGWIAWPSAIAAAYLLLWRVENEWPRRLAHAWHAGTSWLFVFVAAWSLASALKAFVSESDVWAAVMWALVPAAVTLALQRRGRSSPWPLERFADTYHHVVPAGLGLWIAIWVVWACTERGNPAPLPYVPVLNPLELTQAIGLLTVSLWWSRTGLRRSAVPSDVNGPPFDATLGSIGSAVLAVVAFLALNAMVGRVVHFFAGVPYNLASLGNSAAFQAGISVLWAMTALSIMSVSSRHSLRHPWFVGAGLLAMLIVKLFAVDLGNLGGVARIVSFLVTGLLILVIGYVSPMPPKPEKVPA